MKKVFAVFILSLLCFQGGAQAPKLYINFVSHNEPVDSLQRADVFAATYPKILQMAHLVQDKGAKWNFQTCDGFVDGVLNHQAGASIGNDALDSLEIMGVEIDPRSKSYKPAFLRNIADCVDLLTQAGVNPSHTLGGFLYWAPSGTPDWFNYEDTIYAQGSGNGWKANIIWGAGSPNHVNDYNDYGIFKPDSLNTFNVHNPARNLWYIGNGCQPIYALDSTEDEQIIIDLLNSTVDSIQNGLWDPGNFYVYSVVINVSHFGPTLYQKVSNVIDAVNALDTGAIEWATLNEKFAAFEAWQLSTGRDSSMWECGHAPVSAAGPEKVEIQVYPNPGSGKYKIGLKGLGETAYQVINLNGGLVDEGMLREGQTLDISGEPGGVYMLVTADGTCCRLLKW